MTTHIPVLIKEVLHYLNPKPNENIIDATIGQAGHTLLILEKVGPEGKVLGIDLDAGQIANAKLQTENMGQRAILVHDSYVNIKDIAAREHIKPINGILLDLGYSSWQIDQSTRGFSFNHDAPLDMRYNLEQPLNAQKIVNEYPEAEIEKILKEYGEEKFAKQIAKHIIEIRQHKKIDSTFSLKKIIEEVIPDKFHHGRIHCATKSFQALRIAVNDELGSLNTVLPDALSILAPGGRLVVISFHSLEDRIVKNYFKKEQINKTITILTKKPIMAGYQEIESNPRSRSAKLRAIEVI